jgi:aminopeptidase N
VLAAPGFQEQRDDGTRSYALNKARAFSFLASPDYVRQDGSAVGVPVSVFTTPRHQAAGEVVLTTAIQAIDLFSELYGPYPYDELIIAENGFLTAMEYSGLVSLSGFAFDAYDGSPSSLLVAITAHEVAHQWWYGGVGNDQTREPWLDEGLAMMSELLFYERHYPQLTDWWWDFRVNRWNPVGYVDDSIYQYADSESFVHNVYGVAAYFMDELRNLMGQDAFEQFLQRYFSEHRDSFVSREDFFTAVEEQTDIDLAPLIAKYFAEP